MTRTLLLSATLFFLPVLASGQSGAGFTGSATHLLFAEDSFLRLKMPYQVFASTEQSDSRAGDQHHTTRHFLVSYHARIGHHQNQFGATAGARLELDATKDNQPTTKEAVHQLDSLGLTPEVRGYVKSVEVRTIYGVLIEDERQPWIGIEFGHTQAYSAGLDRMRSDTLPREYHFNAQALYMPLRAGTTVDAARRCFSDPGNNDKDTSLQYCAAADHVICIEQSLGLVSSTQASYRYTSYRTSGTRTHVDSLNKTIIEQRVQGNDHFADSLRMDLLIVKDSSIRNGTVVHAPGHVIIYDVLSGRRYNVSRKRGRSLKLHIKAEGFFIPEQVADRLYLPSYRVLPKRPQQQPDAHQEYQVRCTDADLKITTKGSGLFLPPAVLRFLYGGLRSY